MTEPASPLRWTESYEQFLRSLSGNKAAMSDLRSGRNKAPEACLRLHRWVAGFVDERQVNTGHERAVYSVAALFAVHRDMKATDRGLGASLAQLRRSGKFSDDGLQTRLIRLCRSATSEELCRNLWPVVSLIASGGVPLSWSSLTADIASWDFRSDAIARRWLRDFFSPTTETETHSTDTNTAIKDS